MLAAMSQPDAQATPRQGQARRRRRDAELNRARVLAAARMAFGERGIEATRVEDVAAAAGVGVGTIYRGFGDKGGLVAALLDERERELQEAVLRGAPPLGPGADPPARLRAFLDALVELVEENAIMLAFSENSRLGARYRIGAYHAWRLHLRTLLGEAAPELDADWHADALLAPLAADLYLFQREQAGISEARVRAGLQRLLAGLL